MPYITQKEREFILYNRNLVDTLNWLITIPVERRKGYVAFIVNHLGKFSFTQDYFGKSTGTDAVRSAFTEMKLDLARYEELKRVENGDV